MTLALAKPCTVLQHPSREKCIQANWHTFVKANVMCFFYMVNSLTKEWIDYIQEMYDFQNVVHLLYYIQKCKKNSLIYWTILIVLCQFSERIDYIQQIYGLSESHTLVVYSLTLLTYRLSESLTLFVYRIFWANRLYTTSWSKGNPPHRGGFLFTMFPHQEPWVRGSPSKNLVQILRGGSSYSRFLMREHSK